MDVTLSEHCIFEVIRSRKDRLMPLMPSFMLFHALRMAELRLALSLAAGDQKLHSNTEILRLGLGQPQVCSREKCEALRSIGWKVLLGSNPITKLNFKTQTNKLSCDASLQFCCDGLT